MREFPPYRPATNRDLAWMRVLGYCLIMGTLSSFLKAVEPGLQSTPANQARAAKTDATDQLPRKETGQPTAQSSRGEEVTARQLLQLYGIEESQWDLLSHEVDWSPEAEETTTKILLHLPKLNRHRIHRWSTDPVPWDKLTSEPAANRSQFFRLRGRVNRVEKETIVKEAAKLLQFDHYFRVSMKADGIPDTVVVFTRNLPTRWPLDQPLDERVEVSGLFLKVSNGQQRGRKFFFAAPRIAWFPDRVDKDLGITQHHLLLANLGVDVGLFSRITRQTEAAFVGDERECFFQLLDAMGKTRTSKLARQHPLKLVMAEILGNPTDKQGRLYTLEGTAQRITRIVVGDAKIQERYGIDHYYQVDLLVPLEGKSIQIKRNPGDEKAPVFTNAYPINVCVRTLSPELEELNQQLAAGNQHQALLKTPVRMQGFFFKLWKYKTEFVSTKDEDGLQLSPVFMASEPEVLLPHEQQRNPYFGTIILAAFLIALAAIWGFLWRNSRSERQFKEITLKRRWKTESLEPLESLKQLEGSMAETEPDPKTQG